MAFSALLSFETFSTLIFILIEAFSISSWSIKLYTNRFLNYLLLRVHTAQNCSPPSYLNNTSNKHHAKLNKLTNKPCLCSCWAMGLLLHLPHPNGRLIDFLPRETNSTNWVLNQFCYAALPERVILTPWMQRSTGLVAVGQHCRVLVFLECMCWKTWVDHTQRGFG